MSDSNNTLDGPLHPSLVDPTPSGFATAQLDERLHRLGGQSNARRRLNAVLPWTLSIAAHAALLTIALAVTWAVVRMRASDEAVLIVADFSHPNYAPIRDDGEGDLVGSPRPTNAPLPSPSTDHGELAATSRTGVGAPAAAAAWSTGRLRQGLRQLRRRARRATRVVYVVDASGSMVGSLPIVVDEIARSLRSLSPEQSYAVIFSSATKRLVDFRRSIASRRRHPSRSNGRCGWIGQRVVPAGRSNPMHATETALRLRPDAIFLLSTSITGSGQFEIDQREILDRLDRLNPADATGRRHGASIHPVPRPRSARHAAHGSPGRGAPGGDGREGKGAFRFLGRAEPASRPDEGRRTRTAGRRRAALGRSRRTQLPESASLATIHACRFSPPTPPPPTASARPSSSRGTSRRMERGRSSGSAAR
ncbi:MAG: hypothetical protein U0575_15910 [Phycisphaerales bacterium]